MNEKTIENDSWLLDGTLSIDKFKEMFNIEKLPIESSCHTLAGFVLAQMRHIPSVGDYFECNGLRFEVMDKDKNRFIGIGKMLVTRTP